MHFLQARHLRRLCAAAALSTSGAGGLSGCTYTEDCSEERMCVAPPPSPCEVNEPGVGPVMDECGVFARASAPGDAPRAGTRAEPFTSLQDAIVEAQARGLRHVYACGETFQEEVTLTSGIHLWGARRCEDGDWSVDWSFGGPNGPTVIAPPSGIPLRVVGDDGATSVIYGVRVVAADASASDGKSSIAMLLSAGAGASVRSSAIVAGDGKDGEPGKDADSERAADGVEGNDGASACTDDSPTGALPVVTVCGDGIESTGGYGGDGGLESGGDGAPGQPEPAANQDQEKTGLGGAGADVLARCGEGKPGPNGANADRADGAVGMGYLTEDGWVGTRGDNGKRGGVGHGGGGGGGSKGRGEMVACRAGRPEGGAAGGSGGSGGCGGLGGYGGGYGGASIGVVALQGSSVTLEATTVTAGNGGAGGVGGTGQPGGVGRPGGDAGKGMDGLWDACPGGKGGNGGRGGDAGGGLGGSSYGVASIGAYVGIAPDASLRPGGAGDGGPGGNAAPGDPVGKGEWGHSLPYVQFEAPEPEPPH
ncbi:hypothetical protein WMF45_33745 [Sorangium sp. So ce448]|uniref:hypothetical protein n=1 Tax=Sorangium sp. So ce448 TaxID=3133314 RepID=UPI003F62645B